MTRKKKTSEEMIAEQLAATNENMSTLEKGTKERQIESVIMKEQIEAQMALEKAKNQHELEVKRFEEEKAQFEKKMALDEAKAKSEKVQGWAKVGLRVVEVGLFVGMGFLKLKENMLQGKEQGTDSEPWFRELIKK